jgi:hypothetical protein
MVHISNISCMFSKKNVYNWVCTKTFYIITIVLPFINCLLFYVLNLSVSERDVEKSYVFRFIYISYSFINCSLIYFEVVLLGTYICDRVWVWLCIPVIPALRRLRQKDQSSRLAWDTYKDPI